MSRQVAIVLHAHIPWVRHPEVAHCLEEDWLHSGILETYLPLLDSLVRLRSGKVPFQVTLNFSPTLLAMLEDRILRQRTVAYFDRLLRLTRDEIKRGDISGHGDLAERYEERIERFRTLYLDSWEGDLVGVLKDLRQSGHVELTASAATHGLLPLLMRSPEAARAQIRAGIRQFVKSFGSMPRGFWLPECAYAPSLGRMLREEGLDWTIVEEHGLSNAHHSSSAFPFVPGQTADGLAIFGRDQESSGEIWSADDGYPGDPRYRDFFRDVGLEAPDEYLANFLGESGERQLTGLKYFRSERQGPDSLPYDPALASAAVMEHTKHFINRRGAQLASHEGDGLANPISVCAFDSDLFGHWWFEGTEFLGRLFYEGSRRSDFRFMTPGGYLARHPVGEYPLVEPVSSSWGEGGYFETWTTPENNWVHEEIHRRSDQLVRFVNLFEENRDEFDETVIAHREQCIRLMTRELLLAQSSDWPFLMKNPASREYATERTHDHLATFDQIWSLTTRSDPNGELDKILNHHPFLTDVPWNLFDRVN
ncbi:MAG: 1,4-alpha-glucan branching protein domain-containing protein [Verrucomicrobiota bacterium]